MGEFKDTVLDVLVFQRKLQTFLQAMKRIILTMLNQEILIEI
jgi:hypothetical protein